jgi:hypothetical protein
MIVVPVVRPNSGSRQKPRRGDREISVRVEMPTGQPLPYHGAAVGSMGICTSEYFAKPGTNGLL